MTRDEFIRHCNDVSRFDGIKLFEIGQGGPSTSPYVIADSPSSRLQSILLVVKDNNQPRY